ncbi:MAG TPA: hypothetical protein VFO26_02545 [Gaiella sp.]|uniref:hypothetical protein n=1 Tax=Gaiella sp. TaxID=2663207 RepID=UPI002D80EB9A|nr:hypothetical protein [Gaiella sp.]HET9286415.1 hypothetical protein [Gaiella sp.]
MATEHDSQEVHDHLGDEPVQAPLAEQLEEENPVDSPAQPADGENRADRQTTREHASTSIDPESRPAESTEGLTVGGAEKTPSD